jgi:2-oxoglutarate/2-oxoacid ferredoxin oxidoreductase subunit alpha
MKQLMQGNCALGEGAVQAGCDAYFGYPITPQNEVSEYLSRRMVEESRVFVQSESELAAISMVMGAATTGARAMTSSSSPGVSLMQEGISYLAGCELPAVIANIVRGGPGLGGIGAAQSDYFQSVKGGGHGDYRMCVLAPSSVQETFDCTFLAFDLAFKYHNPVLILSDGLLGQMMEPIDIRPPAHLRAPGVSFDKEPWALTGAKNRPGRHIKSLYIDCDLLEKHNEKLQEKFRRMAAEEVRYETYHTEDAHYLFVAFGVCARICRDAVDLLRKKGVKCGVLRPISLWPFPSQWLRDRAPQLKNILTVELNYGQMVEDVRLAVAERCPVSFFGRAGGCVMSAEDVAEAAAKEFVGH